MKGPLGSLSNAARRKLRQRKQPKWLSPMMATLTDEPFSDTGWIYERKLDGERALAFRRGKDVRLMSRNRKALNPNYPELVDALGEIDTEDFVVDGEIVAFDGKVTSFARLQPRMQVESEAEARRRPLAVYYYLFDVLYLDGHDVTQVPLRVRKRVLRRAVRFADPLRFTAHRNAEGEAYFEQACRKGWEGVIAKEAGSTYAHARSRHWLKFKCVRRQELVIGGYTDPQGERIGFGALLLGYYEDGDFRYAGKVGTGFDDETLWSLSERLERLERRSPPFDRGDLPGKGVHWVRPALVCQVGFTEWTKDGRLRHPRYLGLRRDKDPEEVVHEQSS